ncbi:MAG: nucleoside recognition protein [Candidatus Pelagibacter sp.]|nr:nucleoside recognition protein [Candidatus Pelagibacter sp.]
MFFKNLFIEIKEVATPLFKILIPFIFIIKLLEIIGAVALLSKVFAPLMSLIGLPPELGIVWVTAFAVNIYASLILFVNIIPGLEVTVAQITILTTAMLVCHNLPVESAISKAAGISFIYTVLFRLISAFIICFILGLIYDFFNFLNEPYNTYFEIEPPRPEWKFWIQDQLLNLIFVFGIVVVMVTILQLLKVLGIENFLKKILVYPLKLFGISKEATNIIIVGITIGLQFGGGILIKEVKTGKIDKQSVFLAVSMLNLVHAAIEDTLLMIAIGGHYSGVFFARIIFGLMISLLMFKIYKKFTSFYEKYVFDDSIKNLPTLKH